MSPAGGVVAASAAAFLFALNGSVSKTVLESGLQPWWTFPWADLTRSVPLPGPLPDADIPAYLLVLWVVVLGTVVPYGLIRLALRSLAAGVAFVVLTGIVLAETARQRRPEVTPVPDAVTT